MQMPKTLGASKQGLWARLSEKSDVLVCIVDQGVVSVAGFVTSILIGRHASAELGVYYIALSIVLFLKGIQHQLVLTPYTIYQQQYKSPRIDEYRGSCLIQYAGLMLVAIAFIACQAICAWLGWGTPEAIPTLLLLLALTPMLMVREVVRTYCFTHMQNVSALVVDCATSILQIGAILLLGLVGLLSGESAWCVIGLASLIVVLVWQVQVGPKIKFKRSSIHDDWTKNWSFGKWAVGGQIIGSLPTYLLPWILASAVGASNTGLYAAAMTLVGLANILNVGMANFLTPKATLVYAEKGRDGLKKTLLEMALLFALMLGTLIVMIAFFGDWAVQSVYGSDYVGLRSVMIFLAIAKLFESLSIVATAGLVVMEKIKTNFVIDICLMVVTLIAAISLVFPYGVEGAAWTVAISAVCSSSMRSAAIVRYLALKSRTEEPA